MAAVAMVGCMPIPVDKQFATVQTSSDGATEGTMIVSLVEMHDRECSAMLQFGQDNYDRGFILVGVGQEALSGDAALVYSVGIETPWHERDPIHSRLQADVLFYPAAVVYELGVAGSIDESERITVRVRGGLGLVF